MRSPTPKKIVTTAQMLAFLLHQQTATIAQLREILHEKDIAIWWLKGECQRLEAEITAREQQLTDKMVESWMAE